MFGLDITINEEFDGRGSSKLKKKDRSDSILTCSVISMENCEDPIEAQESADQTVGDVNKSQDFDGKVMQQFKQCLDISLSNFYSSIRYKLNFTFHKT